MAKLVSVVDMREIEKTADAGGLSYAQMMENAGNSLANLVISHSQQRERTALGLVGPGNNGGDTLVALAALAEDGWKTTAYVVGDRKDDDYVKRLLAKGGKLMLHADDTGFSQLKSAITEHAILLDGLLGTGIRLPLREPFAQVLRVIKDDLAGTERYVVAVDCPSGMDADSGEVANETLRADLTVTMAALKRGMLTLPAFEYLGELRVGEIGLGEDLREWADIKREVIDERMVRAVLPARPLDAHKGTFGTALIVAGSQQFPGSTLLAAKAAYRSGAGLVIVATPKTVQPVIAGQLPEATWLPLSSQAGWISGSAATAIKAALGRATAMLIGPGLGQAATTKEFVTKVLKFVLPPLVVDADGLKLLVTIKDWAKRLPRNTVLTPHPGEMSILTGLKSSEIQSSRIETAEKFAKKWNHVVVLKGAFTVVAAPDRRSVVMPLATPALARAGTGDVLAGLITGLRAQGMHAYEAACAGVWLHGQAGPRAAARLGGTAGVLAGDLIAELPALIAK